ncbi:GNAT family N-acetyltransferase [Streptomyces sp. Je 1-369]|uniref:GNAT family N-acetyltransferase n=1 Tax=Streptomyces sp. Je 1-369 TaxID=2966192 RepID=UPI0022869E66|nr:GNAT family N-acetyltransferase [Streptomyces sp. Je 1-369]WAL93422.1 GNAT family N-acetyltransferase [Streptomyces sp. Je 1-369]
MPAPATLPDLQLLRADHVPALRAFEETNRAYFAASVPDRGDAFFHDFDAVCRARLAEQATGACLFHVLVDDGGEILGRVNLIDVADGGAELGYRIAEKAAGQGLATRAVRQVCGLARTAYGLTALRAATTLDNPASQTVLTRAGFVPAGDIRLDGRPGISYALTL